MVFQNYALYPHMTVYENMAFGLRMRGYSTAEIDARVRQSAEMLEIGGLLERRPAEISGGQRQRVAVGRAIVRRPRVFLFDEPFSNLDAKLRAQARADLLQLHRRLQTTMIYVTHDQVEAMTLGDRICVMKDGEVQQIGPPPELYRRPKNRFVAEFIGGPSMNLFEVTIQERGGNLWLDQGHFQLRLPARYKRGAPFKPGRPILAGFRPEDLRDRLFEPGAVVDGNVVIAVVRLVEPVGPETHVHLESGGARFIARLPSTSSVQINQPMEILFNMERVHLFSRDGRDRLGPDA
jgi:multiple sugar transport system ATP-binding protein